MTETQPTYDAFWDGITAAVRDRIRAIDPAMPALIERSGRIAQIVAENIRTGGYTVRDEHGATDQRTACAYIADALSQDIFGPDMKNDRWTVNDRGSSPESRKRAQERIEWRMAVARQFAQLDDDTFAKVVDRLADAVTERAA